MSVNFRSDNESPVAPEIIDAMRMANQGFVHSYGEDALTARLGQVFSDLFETDVMVWPLATGTAANSLAMAQICPPYGSIYCHAHAHINTDECGAPEFYTAGGKLVEVAGTHGRIDAKQLAAALAATGQLGDHEVMPAALSLSQATEFGTIYQPGDIATLASLARSHGLRVHMDGARFANALVTSGASPAELTWKAGVDMLSFGATKNGAMMAEALLLFDPGLGTELGRRRKRAGHLLSKMRFIAAQLIAYLEDGRWLAWAGHANAMARRLADGLSDTEGIELLHPVEANEVFVRLDDDLASRLHEAGFGFHRWPGTADEYRLVCAWCTVDAEIDALLDAARKG